MRPWILSLLATALVVSGALALYPRGRERPSKGTPATVPGLAPLTEADVRTFIEVQGKMLGIFQGASADLMQRVREGKTMEEAAAALKPLVKQAQLTILIEYHKDLKWYEFANQRISKAVDAVRFSNPEEPLRKQLEREIDQAERLFKAAIDEEKKLAHADQIARLKRSMKDKKDQAPLSDQQLVHGYWQALDALVPRTLGVTPSGPLATPERPKGR